MKEEHRLEIDYGLIKAFLGRIDIHSSEEALHDDVIRSLEIAKSELRTSPSTQSTVYE